MKPTDIGAPDYFHKVVDCQWACPAHTPVPEYIRLIAAGRYSDAYMINWKSNVFPGVLGRTCDRPCEPACRRGRVEENNGEKPEPVAICRINHQIVLDLAIGHHRRVARQQILRLDRNRHGGRRHQICLDARRIAGSAAGSQRNTNGLSSGATTVVAGHSRFTIVRSSRRNAPPSPDHAQP